MKKKPRKNTISEALITRREKEIKGEPKTTIECSVSL